MDTFEKMILAFLVLWIAFNVMVIHINDVQNTAKMQVFEKITNNSTNKEIISIIQDACSDSPWYIEKTSCESDLLKKFILSTK